MEHLFHYTNPGWALGSLPSPRAPVWAASRLRSRSPQGEGQSPPALSSLRVNYKRDAVDAGSREQQQAVLSNGVRQELGQESML